MRITINNLASEAHEEDLRTLFELFGRVGSIEIKKDQGRAFVEMSSKSAGKEAITELNGQNLLGFEIEVEFIEMYKGQPLFSEVDDGFFWQEIPFAFGDYSPYNTDTQSSEPDGKFNADERETDYLIFLDSEEEGITKSFWVAKPEISSKYDQIFYLQNELVFVL